MEKILGIARHVISGVGAALVGFGLADADTIGQLGGQVEAIVGGVMFIAGIVASVIAKLKG